MKIIDWLLKGDIVIQYLTNKYLLNKEFYHNNGGYIGEYLDLYNIEENIWGRDIYTSKWSSSTYTLLELKYMEIDYNHPYYQKGTKKVFDGLWKNGGKISKTRYQDMCMSGMVLSLVSYGKFQDSRINEIVDYILDHQMSDGGWNCAWDSVHNKSFVGSVHTTLTILESILDYEKNGYTYRVKELKSRKELGQEYLLKRKLFKSLTTGKIIHKDMVEFHYPYRWKYDCFRALEYFVKDSRNYDSRMEESLDLTRRALFKGYVKRGKKYPGKIHFPLETTKGGRFNTYRALLILKYYDKEFYNEIIKKDFKY